MSVYVGIDVHRKRSQVAVIDANGEVLANRNVPNGAEPILKGSAAGRRAPRRRSRRRSARGGWWNCWRITGSPRIWCTRCGAIAIASARLKNDKGRCRDLGAAAARRPALGGVDRPARCPPATGDAASPGGAGAAADPAAQTGSTRCWPTMVMTGRPGAGAARAGPGSPPWNCQRSPGSPAE